MLQMLTHTVHGYNSCIFHDLRIEDVMLENSLTIAFFPEFIILHWLAIPLHMDSLSVEEREISYLFLKKVQQREKDLAKGSRITTCRKALQSQWELSHYSFAHSLKSIHSSRVLKDNEHANYFLRAQKWDEELLWFSDVLTQAEEVRNVIVKQSSFLEPKDGNHRWVLPVALQSQKSGIVCSSSMMLLNQIWY